MAVGVANCHDFYFRGKAKSATGCGRWAEMGGGGLRWASGRRQSKWECDLALMKRQLFLCNPAVSSHNIIIVIRLIMRFIKLIITVIPAILIMLIITIIAIKIIIIGGIPRPPLPTSPSRVQSFLIAQI